MWNSTQKTIYDSWVIGCFNVFFTSLPPLCYGVFERDLRDETIDKYPQLYRRLQKGQLFTPLTFLSWLADAVWESLGAGCLRPIPSHFPCCALTPLKSAFFRHTVVFFAVYFMFQNDVLLSDGETLDLWSFGIFVGTFITMFINFRLFLYTKCASILSSSLMREGLHFAPPLTDLRWLAQ